MDVSGFGFSCLDAASSAHLLCFGGFSDGHANVAMAVPAEFAPGFGWTVANRTLYAVANVVFRL